MCAAFVFCLLGRVITVHVYMCRYFVNGVSMYGLAVLEALWRPTGIKFAKNAM